MSRASVRSRETDEHLRYADVEPICGKDFCDGCGDCISCFSGDCDCGGDGTPFFIVYEDDPRAAPPAETTEP